MINWQKAIETIDYESICICEYPDDIVKCNCDWLAFKEGEAHPFKIFTKKQVQSIKTVDLFS